MEIQKMRRFIVVTGGPYSGVGKGIVSSSIGLLLKARGINVTAIKIDGYLNRDAGTMSPFEHGEVYVTADGGETDLDIGNYERFIGLELTRAHSMTMGKIYERVASRERAGEYLGKTVQTIPHVTDEISTWIREVADMEVKIDGQVCQPDVCIVEIGGTVGDIETLPVFHAIKRMCADSDTPERFCFVHVSALTYVGSSDGDREPKTKPTQQNIEKLWQQGIRPDILVMRCEKTLPNSTHQKLHTQCFIPLEGVISCYDVKNIHYVPDVLKSQNVLALLETKLSLHLSRTWNLNSYYRLLEYFDTPDLPSVKLAIVGKYTGMNDTYLSLIRAIQYGGFANNVNVEITWIDAESLTNPDKTKTMLANFHGILVPGGFGKRGITGMEHAVEYCYENKIPYLGICLGMQVMITGIMNSVSGLNKYYCSTEWEEPKYAEHYPVIDLLPEQDQKQLGGTMRLGNYETILKEGTLAHKVYGSTHITERHRHRYEVDKKYVDELSEIMTFSGYHKETGLCEITELPDHPFMIGCQFHPEYRSRYWEPHPLFVAFIKATFIYKGDE